MTGLPAPELAIFVFVVAIYLAAAIIGVLQLKARGEKYKRLLLPLVCLAVTSESVLLIFRAAAIKAVPLTGLFESMIVLTIVFGLVYLFFSVTIQQVWFASVMVWVILAMILLTAIVAKPASEPQAMAATPWAISHGIVMILSGASVTFAAATAVLYLLGSYRLKQKKVMQVLGKVPNIEKLEHMNQVAVAFGFVLITFGLATGLGLTTVAGTGITRWLTDAKVLCIIAAWVLLGITLTLNHLLLLKAKTRAYITIVVFVLVLFAILGVTILGVTRHDFSI